MDTYTLQGAPAYLHPTPAGAYVAVSHSERDAAGHFLLRLLRESDAPLLTPALLVDWTGLPEAEALAFLYRLQEAGLVQGLAEATAAPRESFQTLLPTLLSALSLEGRAVLADPQGLALGSTGYSAEATEELAALAADVAALQARHAAGLNKHFRLGQQGWGIVSPAGYSELGCWPLYLGEACFTLVLHGEPRLNQQAFTQLMWALGVLYAR